MLSMYAMALRAVSRKKHVVTQLHAAVQPRRRGLENPVRVGDNRKCRGRQPISAMGPTFFVVHLEKVAGTHREL